MTGGIASMVQLRPGIFMAVGGEFSGERGGLVTFCSQFLVLPKTKKDAHMRFNKRGSSCPPLISAALVQGSASHSSTLETHQMQALSVAPSPAAHCLEVRGSGDGNPPGP